MPNPLEYEEESEGDDSLDDLFGSEGESELPSAFVTANTKRPIGVPPSSSQKKSVSPVRVATPPVEAHTPRLNSDQRLEQLRQMHKILPPPPAKGVDTLKAYAMTIVRMNAPRIWDIGDIQYSVVAELLDGLGREQLNEIETNSPHIMDDTDKLWEAFLIAEHPVFYERCRDRKGEPRTSGWRRMYNKAVRDAVDRQHQAAERLAERYRQLEQDRASKKVVVLDELVAPKKGRKAHSFSSIRRGAAAAAPYSAGPSKAQTSMAKARSDAQRARVALTHASGRYVPPAGGIRRPPPSESELFRNPYLPSGVSTPSATPTRHMRSEVTGPRLPAPGRKAQKPATPVEEEQKAKLPAYITPTPRSPPRERFKIDSSRREVQAIHKPVVSNFEAPKAARPVIDFFSRPAPLGAKRPAPDSQDDAKRARVGSGSPSRPGTPGTPSHQRSEPPSINSLESILFAKKKRKVPAKR